VPRRLSRLEGASLAAHYVDLLEEGAAPWPSSSGRGRPRSWTGHQTWPASIRVDPTGRPFVHIHIDDPASFHSSRIRGWVYGLPRGSSTLNLAVRQEPPRRPACCGPRRTSMTQRVRDAWPRSSVRIFRVPCSSPRRPPHIMSPGGPDDMLAVRCGQQSPLGLAVGFAIRRSAFTGGFSLGVSLPCR
jgi:hypothetical protein